MNLSNRLTSGSALRLFALFIGIIISFFMMPFIIHMLGSKTYGLWVIVASILSFFSLLDMGVSSATQRYVAYSLAKNDLNAARQTFATAFYVFLLIGFIALLSSVVIAYVTPFFLPLNNNEHVFRSVIFILGLSLSIGFPFLVVHSVITSYLRYDISSYIEIAKLIIRAGTIFAVLEKGYSVLGMAITTLAVDLLSNIALLFAATRLATWISFSITHFKRTEVKSIVHFGKFSFLATIAERLKGTCDSLVISSLINLSSVTPYQIALQISRYFLEIMVSGLGLMVPVFTQAYAEGDHDKLKRHFLHITHLSSVAGLFVLGGIACMGKELILLWMGAQYQGAFVIMVILSISMFLSGTQIPAVNMLYAIKKHNYWAYISLSEGILNITLSVVFAIQFGLIGVALGTLISSCIARILAQPFFTCRLLEIPLLQYFGLLAKPVLVFIPFLLVFYTLKSHLNLNSNYLNFFALCFSYTVFYGITAWFTLIEDRDRQFIMSKAKTSLAFMSKPNQ